MEATVSTRTCEECGAAFELTSPWHPHQRFCGRLCKKEYHLAKRRTHARLPRLDFTTAVDLNGPGGCWIWKAGQNGPGYGGLHMDGQFLKAHRAFYEAFVGPIPSGMQLDHLCRVTRCVNPDHLEPVTNAENQRRGSNTKLREAQVREIRFDRDGEASDALAAEFGVSPSLIRKVRGGVAWPDVTRPRDVGVRP